MKIIQEGSMFSIHSDDIKTHDKLPAAFYEVLFNPKAGYALKQAEPLKMTEKAYGSHPEKIEKVMHHFRSVSRNAGVILSGNKGIGKSFFAKSLAIHAVEEGYPVLIVTDNTPALPWFINSVQQEVVILMDEFDKTFPKEGEAPTTQENMLSLLDGLSTGKKLFIVTCNELNKMSEFVVNRPGRFHYHFRFENPSRSEMELYLKDKVKPEYHKEIPEVLGFAAKVEVNYDCLRAIATELNYGYPFKDAVKDLNIMRTSAPRYEVSLVFDDGSKLFYDNLQLDLFDESGFRFYLEEHNTDYEFTLVTIDTTGATPVYDLELSANVIPASKLKLNWYKERTKEEDEDDKAYNEQLRAFKAKTPLYVVFKLKYSQRSYHYYDF